MITQCLNSNSIRTSEFSTEMGEITRTAKQTTLGLIDQKPSITILLLLRADIFCYSSALRINIAAPSLLQRG